MRPLRVFLCHASQDKPAVRKLHRYLKQHGIQPWLDQEDLLPGENWEVEIPRALNASDVILVCLSKNSVNKEGYVQKEISFALDKALEKPEGTIFIIPAKLEDCDVPKRLNRYQWVDLFRPDSNKRLLLGLNKRALSLGSDVSPLLLDDVIDVDLEYRRQKNKKILVWMGGILAFGILMVIVQKLLQLPLFPAVTQTFEPIPTLGVGSTMISEKDGMSMNYVPAGEFSMGDYTETDEQPIHSVELTSFWIDQTEVSNIMYEKCVSEGKCNLPNDSYYFGKSNYANYPVVQVSWNDAVAYCFWANRRLPTEAEWEKAARGPSGNPYPWGSELPNKGLLNYDKNIGAAVEIRKYPAGKSFYGVYDMAGNVWEWVSSLYKPYPYDSTDGRENMDSSAGTRVFRGGSWKDADIYVRSANRGLEFPTVTNLSIGFRCADSP